MNHSTPLEKVLQAFPDAKQRGKEWIAHCSAHEPDEHPSLNFTEGEDGTVLVKCRAGCSADAIVKSAGLTLRDLFPSKPGSNGTSHRRPVAKAATKPARQPKIYPTMKAAIAGAAWQTKGTLVATYDYRTDNEFRVLRFNLGASDTAGKPDKQFRPLHRTDAGWLIADPPGLLPLYKREEVIDALEVWGFEGEGCVDETCKLGVVCTTSAHGSQCAHKSDWSPLSGKIVILFADNDETGRKHMRTVATIVTTLPNPARVKIIELPGLPEHGDIVDFLAERDSRDTEDIIAEIRALINAAPWFDPMTVKTEDEEQTLAAIAAYIPFPSELLPEPLRSFVIEAATTRRVDGAFIALTTLAAVAACIGTTRCIRLQRTWREFAILWGVLVARSGTMKSPCFDLAMEPLRKAQHAAFKAFDEAMDEYKRQKLHYETSLADWKKDKKRTGEPPEEPTPPVCARMVVSDATTEALAPILKVNSRGVLLARDELRGWVGGFDAYKNAKGGDSAFWLEVHRGGAVTIDRKTGQRVIHVPMAAVSVAGTIQPSTFKKSFTGEHFGSGLVARMLVAWPPTVKKRWHAKDVSQKTLDRYANVIDRLLTLTHDFNELGDPRPIDVPMTADARTAWIKFYGAHADRQADAGNDNLAAAFAKHEAHAARFALSFALVEAADRGDPRTAVIEARHVEAGAALAEWFCDEAERLYAMLSRSDEDRELDGLVEFIQRRGGAVSVRDVQQFAPKQFRGKSDVVREHLDQLKRTRIGDWETVRPGAKGGRPADLFRLKDPCYATAVSDPQLAAPQHTTIETAGEFDSSVAVASVARSEGTSLTPSRDTYPDCADESTDSATFATGYGTQGNDGKLDGSVDLVAENRAKREGCVADPNCGEVDI